MAKASTIITEDIIPTGKITGISRREDIYDSEAFRNAVTIATVKCFRNYSAYADTNSALITKQEYQDTNLGGATAGGLPNAMVFIWYKWRSKLRSKNSTFQTAANANSFYEECRRLRQSTVKIVNFAQSKYITAQGDETVSFTDCEQVASTLNASFIPTPNVAAHMGKDVTINGLPREISSLQDFNVETSPLVVSSGAQGAALLLPTVNIYITEVLAGVLTRGVAA